jgi:hypothetical protein
MGGEFRHERTALGIDVVGNDWSTYARAFGGETTLTPVQGITSVNMPGLAGTPTSGNNLAMRGLLNLLSGSLSRVTQLYWLGSADSLGKWDDYRNDPQRNRELRQNQFSFFFKDDWKATPDLTLNLGVRWDYYGIPWVHGGLTPVLVGGGNALFGYSGGSFADWMSPGQRGALTELGFGAVGTVFNGVMQTGALHLRALAAGNARSNLANGNYVALANTLSTLNYAKVAGRNADLPDIPAGVNGAILRYTGFPENFIKTNPQLSTATLQNNLGNANYHSLQTQLTVRPAAGLSVQASHTWSKSLGAAGTFTNPFDRSADYTLQPGHRLHDFRTHGTFRLPIGPQQLLLGNSSGILARFAEGWDISWLFSAATGAPASIVAQNMLYANGVPDIVGPFDVNSGKVRWRDGADFGAYFGEGYTQVRDAQCSVIEQSLRSVCTLNAVADPSGRVVLQHPQPGTRGNLGQNVVEGPGEWKFDTSLSKRLRVRESVSMQLRLDAVNIFNHPLPDDPVLNINNVNFGNILQKGTLLTGGATQFAGDGKRLFKLQLRLEF